VLISAFVFGGRMSQDMPLTFQAFNWAHGVYLAATMGSEATAAAIGQTAMRRDPMAMLPFCGYNMADYFNHWLNIGRKISNPPRIFRVNWFRKDADGKFMWPGFGENMRVLKWIVDRVHGRGYAVESPIGWMPRFEDLNWDGLDFPSETFDELMTVGRAAGTAEADAHRDLFEKFLDRLPKEFIYEREMLLGERGIVHARIRPHQRDQERPGFPEDHALRDRRTGGDLALDPFRADVAPETADQQVAAPAFEMQEPLRVQSTQIAGGDAGRMPARTVAHVAEERIAAHHELTVADIHTQLRQRPVSGPQAGGPHA